MAKSRTSDETATRFLDALWRDAGSGFREVRVIANDKSRPPLQRWLHSSAAVFNAATDYGNRKAGQAVYHGIGLRSDKDGTKTSVCSIPALWVDVDADKAGWDVWETAGQIHRLPGILRPSAMVFSGGGLHCYWFLDTPVHLDPQRIDGWKVAVSEIEGLNRRLSDITSGDPSVCDIGRILRTPGSWNTKNGPSKAKLCEVVYCYDWQRYNFQELTDAAFRFERRIIGPQIVHETEIPKQTPLTATERNLAHIEAFIRGAMTATGKVAKRPADFLTKLWARTRYGGESRPGGYLGINDAITLALAHLHVLGVADEVAIADALHWARKTKRNGGSEEWHEAREHKQAQQSLDRFKAKWAQTRAEFATRKKAKKAAERAHGEEGR